MATWGSDGEFLATVALEHELVHYMQDLLTGIGHWDYLMRASTLPIHLYTGAALARRSKQPPPFASAEVDALVGETNEKLRYVPYALWSDSRKVSVRNAMSEVFGPGVTDDLVSELSAQSLMETEAALAVARLVGTLPMDDERARILKRNLDQITPAKLGALYAAPRDHLVFVIEHHCATSQEHAITVGDALFPFLADLSLAHPAPQHLASLGMSDHLTDFDPAVKYARLLGAFQKLSGETIEHFLKALVADNYVELERILLGKIDFRYPTCSEIYAAWEQELDAFYRKEKRLVAELRGRMCKQRREKPAAGLRKNMDVIYALGIPCIYFPKDPGFVLHTWNEQSVDPKWQNSFITELLNDYREALLAEFFLGSGHFQCPLAVGDVCDAAEDQCWSGLGHYNQIPDSPECSTRKLLRNYGLS